MEKIRHWSPYFVCLCLAIMALLSGCAQNPKLSHTVDTTNTEQPTRRTDSADAQQQASLPVKTTPEKPSSTHKRNKTKKSQPKKSTAKSSPPADPSSRLFYPSVAFNSPFKLKYGEKLSLPNSELNFKISKINDGRCPLEMQCVQHGNAVVTLTLYRNDKRIDVVNVGNINDLPLVEDKQYAYQFQLLDLQPYPTVQFIEMQHYVAELIITKTSLK